MPADSSQCLLVAVSPLGRGRRTSGRLVQLINHERLVVGVGRLEALRREEPGDAISLQLGMVVQRRDSVEAAGEGRYSLCQRQSPHRTTPTPPPLHTLETPASDRRAVDRRARQRDITMCTA